MSNLADHRRDTQNTPARLDVAHPSRRWRSIAAQAVVFCLIATVLAAARPAAAAVDEGAGLPHPPRMYWHKYTFLPERSGPDAYWEPCWPGAGSGDGPCMYMQATGPHTEALNCARWELGRWAGSVKLGVFVPHGNATATVTYRVEYVDAADGNLIAYDWQVAQADISGWTHLRMFGVYTDSLTVTVCNNSAVEGIGTHRWIDRLIGVDAVSAICTGDCVGISPVKPVPGLVAAVYPDNRIAVEWSTPSSRSRAPLAGYRITYSTGGWSSPAYEMVDKFHFSPPLTPGLVYKVQVDAVDTLGRYPYTARTSIRLDPEKLLHTDPLDRRRPVFDTWDAEWVTDDDLRDLRNVADAAGVVDPTPISDGSSAVLSIMVGDYLDAGLSAVAVLVPYVGDLPKLRKLPKFADALQFAKKAEIVTGNYGPAKKLEGLTSTQRALVRKAYRGAVIAFSTAYRNGFKFKRDHYGRVVEASGPLKRSAIADKADEVRAVREALHSMKTRKRINGRLETPDSNGHLLPASHGGPFTLDNVVIQDEVVNATINRELEQAIWRPAVKAGTPVHVRVEVIYNADNLTRRPDQFRIYTLIDNHQAVPTLQIDNVRDAEPVWLRGSP